MIGSSLTWRSALAIVGVALAAGLAVAIFAPALGWSDAAYAGSAACASCHAKEFEAWRGSHHALALAKTDAPPFDAGFAIEPGRRDGKSPQILAEGPDGAPLLYPVRRVIGVDPLFQCLVPGDGGRLQATALAFDVHKREWFDLHAGEPRRPDEWGHWTQRGMTWNFQCAFCHVTDFQKRYDLDRDVYASRYVEPDVGCESCHGPMRDHVDRAKRGAPAAIRYPAPTEKPRRPDEPLPGVLDDWSPSSREVPDARIETCAQCHARRSQIAEGFRPELGLQSAGNALLDFFDPEALDADAYFADGQIRDEDYEWGSFVQSRMYARGVGCSDCHDVHSGKTKKEGNALCLQCHQPALDRPEHTHHEAGTPGALCTSCHMPQTTYMLRHGRHDHSMSTPLPELTVRFGIPSACDRCHGDKGAEWMASEFVRLWGAKDRPRARIAEAVVVARRGDAAAVPELLRELRDPASSAIRRATAAALLEPFASGDAGAALESAAADPDPLVRVRAVRALASSSRVPASRLRDPVRLVRIEAVRGLAGKPVAPADREAFAKAFGEWMDRARFNADHPGGRHELASAFLIAGDAAGAERQLRAALKLDSRAVPARLELADLLSTTGRIGDAITLLEEGARLSPEVAVIQTALGLAYEASGRRDDAARALRQATALDPNDGDARDALRRLGGG
jgi:predicted CXXCH cytochrome family protein